ncbi:MAG: prepilin peptidase [Streptosporangiales bacterium]
MSAWPMALALLAGLAGLVAGLHAVARLRSRPIVSAWRVEVRRPRDVVVPLAAAVACALLAVRFGTSPVLPAYLYLAIVAMPLAAIDVEHHRLPDVLTLPSYPIALALLGAAAFLVPAGTRHLVMALIGMAALWSLYAVLYLLAPKGIGRGDVKLAGVLGIYLGWLGPDAWVLGAFAGPVLGGLFGLALVVTRRGSRRTLIPFGPFMLAGTLAAVLAAAWLPSP